MHRFLFIFSIVALLHQIGFHFEKLHHDKLLFPIEQLGMTRHVDTASSMYIAILKAISIFESIQ